MVTVEELIELYKFEPLPVEGGLYKLTYRTEEQIPANALPQRYTRPKPFGTAILYLYTPEYNGFSALHALPTDEIYHFYMGDPVEMLQLYQDGHSTHITLGHDVLNGQQVQYVAPTGVWMGSYLVPGGKFALVGMTMAPGFTNDDYLGGEREALCQKYPDETTLIRRLTRPEEPLYM